MPALTTELHRYELGPVLGTGATGQVLAAEREQDGAQVAVKMLKPELALDPELGRRLMREAEVGRAVHHPGVVATLDEGQLADGAPFVVFERVHGESLLALLRDTGALDVQEATLVARRVAQLLSAVHAAGYVHRDVKPEHILIGAKGLHLEVHLIDFGICQASGAEPASDSIGMLGTPGYLAPEQIVGDASVDGRTDLYGLGATLFEALSGERLFAGPNPAVIMRRALRETPPSLTRLHAGVPEALGAVVAQLLAHAPDDRPPNARTAARALAPFVGVAETTEARLLSRLLRARASAKAARNAPDQAPTRRIVGLARL